MRGAWWRLCAACGVVGPAAFTAAWATSTLRQTGYSIAEEHLSGLAAPDARDPEIMIAGFVTLGACTTAFGSALEAALGGRSRTGVAPALIRGAGIATIAAGLLRRDRMLLHPADALGVGQSWHNHGHDLVSLALYGALMVAPPMLAHRLRGDPRWSALWPAAIATTGGSTALLALFWSRAVEPWNGIVQRVAVTIPMAAMAAFAIQLLRHGPAGEAEAGRPGREAGNDGQEVEAEAGRPGREAGNDGQGLRSPGA
jgi:hypothetical protein